MIEFFLSPFFVDTLDIPMMIPGHVVFTVYCAKIGLEPVREVVRRIGWVRLRDMTLEYSVALFVGFRDIG